MRNAELMVGRVPRHAILRIYNSACCLEGFGFLGVIDILTTFRDVWEPVPYGDTRNVYFITVASDALVAQIP